MFNSSRLRSICIVLQWGHPVLLSRLAAYSANTKSVANTVRSAAISQHARSQPNPALQMSPLRGTSSVAASTLPRRWYLAK
jgi:hypothetical protein